MPKNAILVGNYTHPQYHSLQNIDQELSHILADILAIQCTEDYGMFNIKRLEQFDLCISYTDCWDQKVPAEQVAGLISFVSSGGGLLVIHNGISLQSSYELIQLMGAKFTGHPPSRQLQFKIAAPDHIILAGVNEFAMEEEPYQFSFDPFTEKTVLLEYRYEDAVWPAAWAHQYGLGRVVYLMPGHDLNAFMNPMYQQIILNSAGWAAMGED
jgi:uncharacterized protein